MTSDFPIRTFKHRICVLSAMFALGFHNAGAQASEASHTVFNCWNLALEPPPDRPLTSDGRYVYFVSSGSIGAVDAALGTTAWRVELGGKVISNLVVRDLDILAVTAPVLGVASVGTGSLRSLSKETGIVNWTRPLHRADQFYLGTSGANIATVGASGLIEMIAKDGSVVVWQRSLDRAVASAPAIGDDTIVIPLLSGTIIALSASDGGPRRTYKFRHPASTLAVISGESVAVGDGRGNLVLYDLSSGRKLWGFKGGGRWSSVTASDKNILAISADNFVYLFAPYRGNVIWKRRLGGRISGDPARLRGSITVAGSGESTAPILDVQNGRKLNQITLSGDDAFLFSPLALRPDSLVAPTRNGISLWSFIKCDETKNAAQNAPHIDLLLNSRVSARLRTDASSRRSRP